MNTRKLIGCAAAAVAVYYLLNSKKAETKVSSLSGNTYETKDMNEGQKNEVYNQVLRQNQKETDEIVEAAITDTALMDIMRCSQLFIFYWIREANAIKDVSIKDGIITYYHSAEIAKAKFRSRFDGLKMNADDSYTCKLSDIASGWTQSSEVSSFGNLYIRNLFEQKKVNISLENIKMRLAALHAREKYNKNKDFPTTFENIDDLILRNWYFEQEVRGCLDARVFAYENTSHNVIENWCSIADSNQTRLQKALNWVADSEQTWMNDEYKKLSNTYGSNVALFLMILHYNTDIDKGRRTASINKTMEWHYWLYNTYNISGGGMSMSAIYEVGDAIKNNREFHAVYRNGKIKIEQTKI